MNTKKKLGKVNFTNFLPKVNEMDLLKEWNQIPEWKEDHKKFDRSKTPSFQTMKNKDLYDKLKENVNLYLESKSAKIKH